MRPNIKLHPTDGVLNTLDRSVQQSVTLPWTRQCALIISSPGGELLAHISRDLLHANALIRHALRTHS